MTLVLQQVLRDIKSLFDDWNADIVLTEEEFIARLKGLNCRLFKELKNNPIRTEKIN